MAQHPSGPCIKPDCDEPGGHGTKKAFCARHAAAADASAAQIISSARPDRMKMHEGPVSALPCGHTASAGDHVISLRGQWVCENCALGASYN